MKRTTYILIGLFKACFLGVIGLLLVFSSGEEKLPFAVALKGEQKEIRLEKIRAIRMKCDGVNVDGLPVKAFGKLNISASECSGVNTLVYPDCEQVDVEQIGDTLLVEFRFRGLEASVGSKIMGSMFVEDIRLDLKIDSMLSLIQINGVSMDMQVKGLLSDSLSLQMYPPSIYPNATVKIDSCRLRVLEVDASNAKLQGKGCTIENLYVNINKVWEWNFTDCEIGTEHVSGSGWHSHKMEKGECKRFIWIPLKEDAKLSIQLSEKTSIRLDE